MKSAEAVASPLQRLPWWLKAALIGGILLVLFIGLAALPLPIPPYLDFQVLYQTDMALLHGISPYDHAGQVNLIAQLAGVAPERVYSLPFPYPPWYALGTLWLAWLPIEAAARIWFGISLVLVLASVWLLTDGWAAPRRMLAIGLAVFFLPVLGSLLVGQYVFPVLLGAALMVYALRRQNAALVAVAAGLLTFKPHIGGPVIIVVLVYLWLRGDAFGRRATAYIVLVGLALFIVGFIADRTWPMSYLRSLLAYRQDMGVATCGLCASLPAILAGLLPAGGGLGIAVWIGALILLALLGLWVLRGRDLLRAPVALVVGCILVVLLASPYLLNYDFVLLLVPLILLVGGQPPRVGWILLASVYVLPFVILGALGRQGNFIFPVCAAILMFLLFQRGRPLDVSSPAAYNHSTIE